MQYLVKIILADRTYVQEVVFQRFLYTMFQYVLICFSGSTSVCFGLDLLEDDR